MGDLVEECIQTIGHTVMVTEPWRDPSTLKRTFCAFEVYVTITAKVRFEAITPSKELASMLEAMRSGTASLDDVQVQIENASALTPEDKQMIDNFIINGPGFSLTNRETTNAVRA